MNPPTATGRGITRWCTVAKVIITETISQSAADIASRAPVAIAQALYQQAQEIMATSVTQYVPKDTGFLADSQRVDPPVMSEREVSVAFGFGAEYAVYVHENPRAGKTMGLSPQGKKYASWARAGEWKFLETPLKAKAPEAVDGLRQAVNELIDRNRAKRLAYATGF